MTTTMKMGSSRTLVSLLAMTAGAWALGACGDDETGTGGAGGAGGAGTTASQASSGSPASTSTGSPASTGSGGPGGGGSGSGEGGFGDGGAGGAGGPGGAGAGGSEPATCFAAEDFSDLFALDTARLCVVARYDAPGFFTSSYGMQPTWGGHGGLLTGAYRADVENGPIRAVDVTRWSAPSGPTGELAAEDRSIDLDLGDDADFGGSQLVDVDGAFTAFAYTGQDFATEGGLVFFDALGTVEVDLLLGGFGLGLAAHDGSLLYTALAPVFATEGVAAGLYGSGGCDKGGIVCSGFAYAQWGDSTGAVTVDANGNAFAVNTSFDGSQRALAFAAEEIAAGGPVAGVELFTIGGFGTPLAALAPLGDEPGLLVYQATDGDTFFPLPAIIAPYVELDGLLASEGQLEQLLTPTADDAPVSLVTDDEGRIWVGVGTESGTTFAVLARP